MKLGKMMFLRLLCSLDLENITAAEMTWETLSQFHLRVLKRWQTMYKKD